MSGYCGQKNRLLHEIKVGGGPPVLNLSVFVVLGVQIPGLNFAFFSDSLPLTSGVLRPENSLVLFPILTEELNRYHEHRR